MFYCRLTRFSSHQVITKVGKAVLNRHKKSETYKQVSDFFSSEGSVNRSLSDLRWAHRPGFEVTGELLGLFSLFAFFALTLTEHALYHHEEEWDKEDTQEGRADHTAQYPGTNGVLTA